MPTSLPSTAAPHFFSDDTILPTAPTCQARNPSGFFTSYNGSDSSTFFLGSIGSLNNVGLSLVCVRIHPCSRLTTP